MKRFLGILLLWLAGAGIGQAQWAVFDIANLKQSTVNYAALVEQLSRQATQISNQVRQIQQFETELKRMGDMSLTIDLVGFPEFRADLDLESKIKTWEDRLRRVDGRGVFGDTRGGIFIEVTADFPNFDGARVSRTEQSYMQPHDLILTVDEFKAVQDDVYRRRAVLKDAIARTSEAMRTAPTVAEQAKLEAVLKAQYSQLASVDAEIALSIAEVQVKVAEAEAMSNARQIAEAETRRALVQQEVRKASSVFRPRYECLLQYVTETRLPK
jgi:hypothetical protein